MDPVAALLEHLRLLADQVGTPTSGELVADLARLGRVLASAVPSLLSASITFDGLDVEVPIATSRTPHERVRASLALDLGDARAGSRLLARASTPGAFLLLADDLGLTSSTSNVVVDGDLVTPHDTAGSPRDPLPRLRSHHQALGRLIEQGWTPERAAERLRADDPDAPPGPPGGPDLT